MIASDHRAADDDGPRRAHAFPEGLPAPAIPARPSRPGSALLYRGLVHRLLRRQFAAVWVRQVGPLPDPRAGPLVAYANHASWWDGFVALLVDREILHSRYRSVLMADEQQLRRFPFFRYGGVFSVDRTRPRAALGSLAYAARLLEARADRALWLFPQGRLAPSERRPITVQAGIGRVVAHLLDRGTGVQLWPVAIRYEFRTHQRPEIFLQVGPVQALDAPVAAANVVMQVRNRLEQSVDALRADVSAERLDHYRLLLRGGRGVERFAELLVRRR